MISAKRAAKRLLAAAGYEVRRKRPEFKSLVPPPKQAGWLVEMLGPSGIGKTTLLRACSKRIGTSWITTDNSRFSSGLKDSGLHHVVYKSALTEVQTGRYSLPRRAFEAKFAEDLLRRDQNCLECIPSCVLNDEGIVSTFGSRLRTLLRAGEATIEPDEFYRPRAFMLLTSSPDRVVKNIKRRLRQGTEYGTQVNRSDEELRRQAAARMDTLRKDAEFAAEHGAPVARIDMDQPRNAQIEQVMAFLDKLAAGTDGVEARLNAARRMLEP